MKKRYLALIPALTCMTMSSALAQAKLEPSLAEVAAKVDTDGDFLMLNKFDGDIKKLVEYGELALDIAKENEPDIPKDLKVDPLVKLLGLDQLKTLAASGKKVDGAWNNRSYFYTGGSQKGILSIYGGADEKLEVSEFAPETTDIALQLRLNATAAKEIIVEAAKAVGQFDAMNEEMNKTQPDLGGMTPFELIEKLDFRANLALDIDPKNRVRLPGVDAPGVEIVARLDDATWAWDMFGEALLAESNIEWETKVEGDVKTYTLPADVAQQMMGYKFTIRVDKKYIWVASKPEVLEAALGEGKKLKDGEAYKKTMATLPQEGNSLIYISDAFLDELVNQYKIADEVGHLDDPDFKVAKPLVDKLVADLTAGDSGIAAVVDVDKDGVNSVFRAPFPFKNYANSVTPMLQTAFLGLGYKRHAFSVEARPRPIQ